MATQGRVLMKIRVRVRIVDPDWKARVLLLGCIVCDQVGLWVPAEPHHLTRGEALGKRDDDLRVIPLCHHHHRGYMGIHTVIKRVWIRLFGTEEELLEKTREQLVTRGFVERGDPRLSGMPTEETGDEDLESY